MDCNTTISLFYFTNRLLRVIIWPGIYQLLYLFSSIVTAQDGCCGTPPTLPTAGPPPLSGEVLRNWPPLKGEVPSGARRRGSEKSGLRAVTYSDIKESVDGINLVDNISYRCYNIYINI
jgi:hypothetical protein